MNFLWTFGEQQMAALPQQAFQIFSSRNQEEKRKKKEEDEEEQEGVSLKGQSCCCCWSVSGNLQFHMLWAGICWDSSQVYDTGQVCT